MKRHNILITIVISCILGGIAFAGQMQNYPLTSTLTDSATIPVVQSGANRNINWTNLKTIVTTGINWQSIPGAVQSTNINWANVNGLGQVNSGAINWTNLQSVASGVSGVNWHNMPNGSAGINWFQVANGATAFTIMCYKANGEPGKCTTGVSGTGCTACN